MVALAGSAVESRAALPGMVLDVMVVLLTALPVLWCRAAPVALAVVTVTTYVTDDLLQRAAVLPSGGPSMWGRIAFLTGLAASLPVVYQVARHRSWSVLAAALAIVVAPTLGIILVSAATGKYSFSLFS